MKSVAIKYKEVSRSSILKPNFHLNEGKRSLMNLINKGVECVPLGGVVQNIYTGGIFKRVFVSNKETGIPYISAQDMMNLNPKKATKLISKKYTPRQDDMTLKENTILVSCAGTIGNIRLIDSSFKDIIGSQDIIRVIPNVFDYGFIYAYLSSKICHSYIQSLIYGSVVPRIEPNAISNIPVPVFPKSKQQEIHNLIIESTKLRVDANELLEKSINLFEQEQLCGNISKTGMFSSSIIKIKKRFNGNYYLSLGANYEEWIRERPFIYLSECVNDIFTSGREKRNYSLKRQGIPFLNNSDLSNINPFKACNYVIRNSNERSLIKENMILAGRVGQETVGQVYLPYNSLVGSIASDNVIRIEINGILEKEYIFAFLYSDIGKQIIRRRKTGVGQPFITEEMLSTIPILLLAKDKQKYIVNKIKRYSLLLDIALNKEAQAISLVEKEIESWQQS
jgi:type I restriction enzyme S subunit